MKRLLMIALLAWVARPKVTRCDGSGEDECGEYNYLGRRCRFGRFTVELNYWPERIER